MSTELTTRIWMRETDVKSNFLNLLNEISTNSDCSNDWKHLSVSKGVISNRTTNLDKINTLGELDEILSNDPTSKITIYVPFACWRFYGNIASKEHVIFAISCWGERFGEQVEFNNETEGNAEISILNVGPYCAVLGEASEIDSINEKVESNLVSFMTLTQEITRALNLRKLLTFSDCGEFNLMNSHLAYFANRDELLDSINQFMTSLRNPGRKIKDQIQHSWRKDDDVLVLTEKIKQRLESNGSSTSLAHVEKVIRSEKFDFFETEEQLIFLNYPHFVNGFLDRLFLELVCY